MSESECPKYKCVAPGVGCRIKAPIGRCATCDVECSITLRGRASSLDAARTAAAALKSAGISQVDVSEISAGQFAFSVVGDAAASDALASKVRDALIATMVVGELSVVDAGALVTDARTSAAPAALSVAGVAALVAASAQL